MSTRGKVVCMCVCVFIFGEKEWKQGKVTDFLAKNKLRTPSFSQDLSDTLKKKNDRRLTSGCSHVARVSRCPGKNMVKHGGIKG